jgi:poly(3-hydroxybutyrate) depolymerase
MNGSTVKWGLVLVILLAGLVGCQSMPSDGLTARIDQALEQAGDNSEQIRQALKNVPTDQRPGMRFLIAYMPQRDLQMLTADYLLINVRLAYQAREQAPWGEKIPDAIFFNDVLPYATIDERRDEWRAKLYEQFQPLVADAKTPGEAAVILNQKIFDQTGVKFSRKRAKANQSSTETIESGLASCTGLSILLIDACRAVGVPARLAGTPLWPDRSGNHSWVEIWDDGWHFTGAAEPSGDQLDRGWFKKRAATAIADHPLHAIYATSYQPTGTSFPMVWSIKDKTVPAVNVTSRYASDNAAPPKPAAPREDIEASLHALAQLKKYLATDRSRRGPIAEQVFADVALTRADAAEAGQLLWAEHVEHIKATRAEEMKARKLTHGDKVMPFFYSVTGDKPADGRSLYISMHGGGGAPERVNTSQWENQKRLYQVEEGVYLAPRAPTNTWNLWHQAHIDPMFDRLIENLIVFEGVDPNRVYLMGYSAGGDGVYQLAPRMADRFAAAAMMAGHPNESKPLGLRNLPFTIHVGAKDAAYKRNEVARQWGEQLDELQKQDPGGYIHWTKIHEGMGHWMNRQDAAALPWMAKYTRNPLPDRIAWRQDNVTHTRFYWLAVPDDQQRKGAEVFASRAGQTFTVRADGVEQLIVRLNDRMADLDKPITIVSSDQTLFTGRVKRTIAVLAKTLAERGDPDLLFTSEVALTLPSPPSTD